MHKKIFALLHRYRYLAFLSDNSSATAIENKQVPIPFFGLSILFYILFQLCMQPRWLFGGEMWAEMATNYFHNANSISYFTKFLSTDAGYIPLPQRLIAFIGNVFSLKAAVIPYFYTWSSLILTPIFVGVFCLQVFRKVVKSDLLRFATVIAVFIVPEFEIRTFVNFTYFVTFFAAVVTALALVDETADVPIWAWSLPVLMVSKPAVLAILPAMILTSLVSKSRFRWIVIITSLLCTGQLIQMMMSLNIGEMAVGQSHSLLIYSKIIASFLYFFGFLSQKVEELPVQTLTLCL